jgi:hypothetical protein
MRFVRGLVTVTFLITVFSCGAPQGDNRAHMLAEQYYRLIQSGDFAGAARLYPDEEREIARAMLQRTRDQRGALKSFHFTGEEQNTVLNGRFYVFELATTYDDGEHNERLTLHSAVNNDEIVLVAQKIDPID